MHRGPLRSKPTSEGFLEGPGRPVRLPGGQEHLRGPGLCPSLHEGAKKSPSDALATMGFRHPELVDIKHRRRVRTGQLVSPAPPEDLRLIGRYEGECAGRVSERPNRIGLLTTTEVADRSLKQ